MSVPAPTVAADLRAAMGKSIQHETNTRLVDDRMDPPGAKNPDAADKRPMEDALGAADKWTGKTPDELAADPDALANMSSQDIMRAMGLEISDKGESVSPEGDATVHDIDTALAEGRATALADDATAMPEAAPAAQPAAATAAPAAATPQPAAAPAAGSATAAAAAQPTTDEYVESRNGQGRIRYEVLQNERERRQRAEAESADLRRQLAERGSAVAAAAPGASEPASVADEPDAQPSQAGAKAPQLLSEQQIASLREKYDESVVDILVSNNRIAVDAYNEVTRMRAEQGERESRSVAEQTQDLIDENPLLSKWQGASVDPSKDAVSAALWQEAIATDTMLKQLPGWTLQEKPWQERIVEAARRVAVAHGIEIPKPNQNSAAAGANTPAQPSLQDRAAAALKAASGHVQLPVSHSDLPAGTPPAQSERDSLQGISVHQLHSKFASMSPDQLEAYLARVA